MRFGYFPHRQAANALVRLGICAGILKPSLVELTHKGRVLKTQVKFYI